MIVNVNSRAIKIISELVNYKAKTLREFQVDPAWKFMELSRAVWIHVSSRHMQGVSINVNIFVGSSLNISLRSFFIILPAWIK